MKISVIGTGYVGMIQSVGLAELGNEVVCVDIDQNKVDYINQRKAPIYEKGLPQLLKKHVPKNLKATTDIENAITQSTITFVCVGTPSRIHGEIKLHYLEKVCVTIGKILKKKKTPHLVVIKSTVVPGTCEKIAVPLLEKHSKKKIGNGLGIAMNPEFLREGSALYDFFNPDRIVVGSPDPKSIMTLKKLYSKLKAPLLATNLGEAEMIKYASNSFLATKISFINEVGNICKSMGIDTNKVAKGVGLDFRISPQFFRAGIGFGGSCFPKDVSALAHKALENGCNPRILRAVLDVNKDQPLRFLSLVEEKLGSLKGKKIALLGLTFKADTDDVRESPSLTIIKELMMHKAELYIYDPLGMPQVKEMFPHLNYMENAQEAVNMGDSVLILTEWPQFSKLRFGNKQVIDGKNIFNGNRPKKYEGVCW